MCGQRRDRGQVDVGEVGLGLPQRAEDLVEEDLDCLYLNHKTTKKRQKEAKIDVNWSLAPHVRIKQHRVGKGTQYSMTQHSMSQHSMATAYNVRLGLGKSVRNGPQMMSRSVVLLGVALLLLAQQVLRRLDLED